MKRAAEELSTENDVPPEVKKRNRRQSKVEFIERVPGGLLEDTFGLRVTGIRQELHLRQVDGAKWFPGPDAWWRFPVSSAEQVLQVLNEWNVEAPRPLLGLENLAGSVITLSSLSNDILLLVARATAQAGDTGDLLALAATCSSLRECLRRGAEAERLWQQRRQQDFVMPEPAVPCGRLLERLTGMSPLRTHALAVLAWQAALAAGAGVTGGLRLEAFVALQFVRRHPADRARQLCSLLDGPDEDEESEEAVGVVRQGASWRGAARAGLDGIGEDSVGAAGGRDRGGSGEWVGPGSAGQWLFRDTGGLAGGARGFAAGAHGLADGAGPSYGSQKELRCGDDNSNECIHSDAAKTAEGSWKQQEALCRDGEGTGGRNGKGTSAWSGEETNGGDGEGKSSWDGGGSEGGAAWMAKGRAEEIGERDTVEESDWRGWDADVEERWYVEGVVVEGDGESWYGEDVDNGELAIEAEGTCKEAPPVHVRFRSSSFSDEEDQDAEGGMEWPDIRHGCEGGSFADRCCSMDLYMRERAARDDFRHTVTVISGDIAALPFAVDALICPTNELFEDRGGGPCHTLYKGAGLELNRHLWRHADEVMAAGMGAMRVWWALREGSTHIGRNVAHVVMTPAFQLRAKYLIHTVVPS
ncbi:hypothetical protein CYMTET_28462, partial [Cymbomonas tetramitiformis]